ncbi:MAG: SulP family inorganic anion transporter [Anaerolineae bacterium]|nr:SulP family inorganic anion transporter [Candidatus Roseilinea sp.]MDW8451279.1 SulP family inorganic anion transporter [Anaerolineae bacterium]
MPEPSPTAVRSLSQRITKYVPVLDWARRYQRAWLANDLIAGATTWGVMTPSAMAYAQLAGLPAQHGLYAAMMALIAYAIFGTSRHVKVTASSTVAVMSASVLASFAIADPGKYLLLSSALALAVGIGLVAAGAIKLGFIADFLSKPIIAGFIFGVAITIIIGQLPKVFGLPGGSGTIFEQIVQFITRLPQTNLYALGISIGAIVVMTLMRQRLPRIPAGLVVLVLSIAVVSLFNLDQRGVSIVGNVPQGLPEFRLPLVSLGELAGIVASAAGIIFLAAGESLGTARAYATQHRESLDADQELIALGASNIASGLAQGFAVDVSLSTTATSENAGARTQMSGVVTAGLVAITLLFLSPLFANLPNAVLGALVILSVVGLLDVPRLMAIYRARRADFLLAIAALAGVLLSDVLTGLVIAVLLALVQVLYRASRPYLAQLGEIPGSPGAYGDIARAPDNQQVPGLLIVRLDAPLYYFNANQATRQIRDLVASSKDSVRAVLLDLGATADLDITSADALQDLMRDMREENIRVMFVHLRGGVRERLARMGKLADFGAANVYPSIDAAVRDFKGAWITPDEAPVTVAEATADGEPESPVNAKLGAQ